MCAFDAGNAVSLKNVTLPIRTRLTCACPGSISLPPDSRILPDLCGTPSFTWDSDSNCSVSCSQPHPDSLGFTTRHADQLGAGFHWASGLFLSRYIILVCCCRPSLLPSYHRLMIVSCNTIYNKNIFWFLLYLECENKTGSARYTLL
jgi:hypothetical protein